MQCACGRRIRQKRALSRTIPSCGQKHTLPRVRRPVARSARIPNATTVHASARYVILWFQGLIRHANLNDPSDFFVFCTNFAEIGIGLKSASVLSQVK